MPEIFFTGSVWRLEGRYQLSKVRNSRIALILHSHPMFGGTMNSPIVHGLYYLFANRGFSTLRFNFRGVGRSEGSFDHGPGELADAASALDLTQTLVPEASACWIAGVSFGAWIGMQLLMRRPEIEGFISIAPPANRFDFTFLAPCPSSGLIVHAEQDRVATLSEVSPVFDKLKTQKGIAIKRAIIPGANHFFEGHMSQLMTVVGSYVDERLNRPRASPSPAQSKLAIPKNQPQSVKL